MEVAVLRVKNPIWPRIAAKIIEISRIAAKRNLRNCLGLHPWITCRQTFCDAPGNGDDMRSPLDGEALDLSNEAVYQGILGRALRTGELPIVVGTDGIA